MLKNFIEEKYLKEALLHSSKNSIHNYEKLEFLGDAILLHELNKRIIHSDLTPKEINIHQQFYLSKDHLSKCAKKLNLNIEITQPDISPRIYANVIEAVIAVIYLYGQNLTEFCEQYIFHESPPALQCSKIELQNLCHQKKWKAPKYTYEMENKLFKVSCTIFKTASETITEVATATSKKEGEKKAASAMLDNLITNVSSTIN